MERSPTRRYPLTRRRLAAPLSYQREANFSITPISSNAAVTQPQRQVVESVPVIDPQGATQPPPHAEQRDGRDERADDADRPRRVREHRHPQQRPDRSVNGREHPPAGPVRRVRPRLASRASGSHMCSPISFAQVGFNATRAELLRSVRLALIAIPREASAFRREATRHWRRASPSSSRRHRGWPNRPPPP